MVKINVRKLDGKNGGNRVDKVVRQYGRVTVMRKLGGEILHFNKDRPLSNKFYSDLKYVQGLKSL